MRVAQGGETSARNGIAGQESLRASVGSTEAPEKDFCGSMRFCTLVTFDP
jgi:hypothetical protein